MRRALAITGAVLFCAVIFPLFGAWAEARDTEIKCSPRTYEDGSTDRSSIVQACELAGGRDTEEFQWASEVCWEQVLTTPDLPADWWARCVLHAVKVGSVDDSI